MQPERFGRYEVIAEIGDGAMGRVYKARDPVVKRFVAIKTIKSEYLTRNQAEEYLKRFRREAQAAGSLNHPNIVRIFDVGENHLVMELLEGRTLHQIIKEHGQMDPEAARAILSPVAEALDHAHAQGIIHRDVKPANIMILPNGQPKLMDFGVAHIDATVMTATGQVLGSPSFMSPEQLAGEEVTPRSDNYSLAVVAYEMLTGQSPFPGKTITAVIYRVMHEEPPTPRKLNESLPERYDEIFARALAKDPEERYASATDFTSALDIRDIELSLGDLLDEEAEVAAPATEPEAAAVPAGAASTPPASPDTDSESPTLAAPAPGPAVGPRPLARRGFWVGLAAAVVTAGVSFVLTRSGPEAPLPAPSAVSPSPGETAEAPSEPEEAAPTPEPQPSATPRVRDAEPARPAKPPEPEPTPEPVTEGQLVEMGPDVTPPRRIEGFPPSYPYTARRRRLEGSVTVSMIVTETGEVTELTVTESAGTALDKAVLEAIRDWRFEPARKDGVKVKVPWSIRHTFRVRR
jgi:serine/threonine-protein kinase